MVPIHLLSLIGFRADTIKNEGLSAVELYRGTKDKLKI